MKLEWEHRSNGDWISSSGWGRFTIQRSRMYKKWILMLGSIMDKYPTVIGSFDSRQEAQRRAQEMKDELDATKRDMESR